MKFFIDTADVKEIRKANEYGLVDGVTTNPSLIAKTGRKFEEVIEEIASIIDGPISVEVTALDTDGMLKQARNLAKMHDNFVIKIPMTLEGMAAVRKLKTEGIKTNVTLVFSANQALIAAKAGATYVSPFVGRLDDISAPGMELIEQIVQIYDNYDFDTEVLVASIRNPIHVMEAAMMGADVATIPFNVIDMLARHPLTTSGIDKFMKDWASVPK